VDVVGIYWDEARHVVEHHVCTRQQLNKELCFPNVNSSEARKSCCNLLILDSVPITDVLVQSVDEERTSFICGTRDASVS
jgi:hypothetical protein